MKDFTNNELKALRHIRNWLVHRGRMPSIRELMTSLGYKSPRSAHEVLLQLNRKGAIRKSASGDYRLIHDGRTDTERAQTVDVPVLGTVAAGIPILAEENVQGFIPISTTLAKPNGTYFLLKVRGDSMNAAGIDDGDFVLVRQQVQVEPGQTVVALIDDEATVKSYHRERDVVLLKPHSHNPIHRPIVLQRDFRIQGVVVSVVRGLEQQTI